MINKFIIARRRLFLTDHNSNLIIQKPKEGDVYNKEEINNDIYGYTLNGKFTSLIFQINDYITIEPDFIYYENDVMSLKISYEKNYVFVCSDTKSLSGNDAWSVNSIDELVFIIKNQIKNCGQLGKLMSHYNVRTADDIDGTKNGN